MRLLLLKQDEISMLEECLDRIDTNEDRELFLGCSRRDDNVARRQTLRDLRKSLAEYGTYDRVRGVLNKDGFLILHQMAWWNGTVE
jgi:hypothetical protein